ncbi:NADPH-dependent thioredoxin reductase 3 [Nymphaea thermarum]|nr:NADPH-dependent thioredoxin reductase 3 [Nymphaea thermarum]
MPHVVYPVRNIFWSIGISACAICDGASSLFKTQVLVGVGGGDTAAEEALCLTKYACHVQICLYVETNCMHPKLCNTESSLGAFFCEIGHSPINSQLLESQVDLDSIRYVLVEEGRTRSSVKGVFAAGNHFNNLLRSTDLDILLDALQTLNVLVKINPSKLPVNDKMIGQATSMLSCLFS